MTKKQSASAGRSSKDLQKGSAKTLKTRELILETALTLFNAEGVEAVSTRQIATAAGISQGNLCYHYPAREQIVETLYQQLWKVFDEMLSAGPKGPPDLLTQPLATWLICRAQYRYRFLMLDFVGIMRRHPAIRQHFRAMVPHRQAQFKTIFAAYAKQGWMLPEPESGVYQRLVMQCYILGDFWLAEAAILFEGSEDEMLLHYTQLLCGMFWPYLTATGRARLNQGLDELPTKIADLQATEK